MSVREIAILNRIWQSNTISNASKLKLCCETWTLQSPILFNLFPEKIIQEALHKHHTAISIGGRPICKLRFADDTKLMGGSSGELQDLTNRLVDRAGSYGIEVSTEKSKIVANSTNNISADIGMNDQKFRK